ncbi:hypothetical protein ANO11243_097030 [Dothideomycetidae sp. 11243]|nr:hypothetical protein ANO11243_097030 [fungal sp. No.11243]
MTKGKSRKTMAKKVSAKSKRARHGATNARKNCSDHDDLGESRPPEPEILLEGQSKNAPLAALPGLRPSTRFPWLSNSGTETLLGTDCSLVATTGKTLENPSMLSSAINDWLAESQLQGSHGSFPYVHPRVLTFPTSREKANWSEHLQDAAGRDTFSGFMKAAFQRKNVRLACASTWIRSWVQRLGETKSNAKSLTWDDDPWHCWGIALVKSKLGGYQLLIWDNDQPQTDVSKREELETLRWHGLIIGTQYRFVEMAREKWRINGLWLSVGHTPQDDQCLRATGEWVRRMAKLPDREWEELQGEQVIHSFQQATRM